MERGRICKLNHSGLYGFIMTERREKVFFHHSGLLNRRFANLATGHPVEFVRAIDRMSGKIEAVNVRVI